MNQLTKSFVVTENQSAKEMGSGSLLVLATPSAIAMAENTCMLLSADLINEEETTVGTAIDFKHLKASLIGATINVEATLEEQKGKKINFTFNMYDGEKLIGKGTHTRYIVEVESFLSHIE